jgi:hypothetical protein
MGGGIHTINLLFSNLKQERNNPARPAAGRNKEVWNTAETLFLEVKKTCLPKKSTPALFSTRFFSL